MNANHCIADTKRAFSLVELMIVVAILGILAAIALPQFQSHTTDAKEAAGKNNLHLLRTAIELYAAQHGDVSPGYLNGDASSTPHWAIFYSQLTKSSTQSGATADVGTAGYPLGPYLSDAPENPFNKSKTVSMISNSANLPSEATGTFGWIYKAATKEIRLDWPGTDNKNFSYYDY